MRSNLNFGRFITPTLIICLFVRMTGPAQSFNQVDSIAVSTALFDHGNILLLNRRWDPALLAYNNALKYSSDEIQQAKIHQNLGSLHFLLSDFQKATIHFEYAFHMLKWKLSETEHLAEICLNLGFTYIEREELGQASNWFDLAAKYKPSDSFLWHLRLALGTGNVLFSRGAYRESMDIYNQAVENCTSVVPVFEEEVWIRKNLAWSFHALGELDSASLKLDQALERINLSADKDSFSVLEILLLKGLLLSLSGKKLEALQVFDEALDQVSQKQSLPADSMDQSNRVETIDVLKYRILYEKINVEWSLSDSIEPDLVEIQRMYNEVLIILQLGEKLARSSSLRRLIAMEPGIQCSLTGIAVELLLYMKRDTTSVVSEIVSLMQRLTRFEDLCYTDLDDRIGILPDSLRSGFNGLKSYLFKLHKQRFMESHDMLKPESELVRERVMTLNKLFGFTMGNADDKGNSLLDCLNDSDPHVAPILSGIRSLLHQDEALLKYLLCDSTLFTILLTTDTCAVLKSDVGNEFSLQIKGYIKSLKVLDPPGFVKFSTRLYHQLLEPVEAFLVNKRSLQIIPDRHFMTLPFDALICNHGNQSQYVEEYLIHRYEVGCYTSLSSWYKLRNNLTNINQHRTYEYDFGACAPEFSGGEAISLPHARHEVEKISRLFRLKNRKIKTLTGKELCTESLLSLASQSRIVHLATHGYKDPDHPEFSGWMMPGDPSPSPHMYNRETRLELGSLQTLQLKSELLVFSSCSVGPESGRSWYRMTNFPYNFFRAGIHHILFSLWNVSDKHTNQFMDTFYRNYLNGDSFSAALRAAKLQMLSTPETAFPTIWSVFVLLSD